MLSNSPIWQQQADDYCRFGIESWTRKGVPFQITSNPQIACYYAKIAAEILKKESVAFLELGGGSGRFAYFFLALLKERPIHYILTDLAEKNVSFWKQHP